MSSCTHLGDWWDIGGTCSILFQREEGPLYSLRDYFRKDLGDHVVDHSALPVCELSHSAVASPPNPPSSVTLRVQVRSYLPPFSILIYPGRLTNTDCVTLVPPFLASTWVWSMGGTSRWWGRWTERARYSSPPPYRHHCSCPWSLYTSLDAGSRVLWHHFGSLTSAHSSDPGPVFYKFLPGRQPWRAFSPLV